MENFTVLYHQEGHVHIQIPELFVIHYGRSLKNPLHVKTSNGIVWNVEFASYRGEVWLTMGWAQVAEAFKFGHKEFVVFRYNGNSMFDVSFFDNGGFEKHPTGVNIQTSVNFVTIMHSYRFKEQMVLPHKLWQLLNGILPNPVLIVLEDGCKIPVKWVERYGTFCITDGWSIVRAICSILLHDFVFIALNANDELNIKVVRMNPDSVINTKIEPRAGMTIGVIERSRGATVDATCRVEDGDSHMGLFNAVDYMVAIYTDEKRKCIQLPPDFTARWGSVLRSPVLITTCDNLQHEVSYYTDQYGGIRLGAGWSRIAKDFNLGVYDVLLFSYNGNSLFDLTLFSSNCHGKTRSPKSTGDFPINIYTMFMYDCFKEKLALPSWCGINYWLFMENPIRICIADGSVWIVRWIEVEGRIWLDEGWKEVVSHCSFKYADDLFIVMRSSSEMELRVVRSAAKRVVKAVDYINSALDIDRNSDESLMGNEDTSCRIRSLEEDTKWRMENEEELWKSSITASRKGPNRPLYIPAQAVRDYFPDKPDKIKVMQPSGEVQEWTFIWTYGSGKKTKMPGKCHFGAGWYNFVANNNLPKGQHIRFFRRRGEEFIRVEITL